MAFFLSDQFAYELRSYYKLDGQEIINVYHLIITDGAGGVPPVGEEVDSQQVLAAFRVIQRNELMSNLIPAMEGDKLTLQCVDSITRIPGPPLRYNFNYVGYDELLLDGTDNGTYMGAGGGMASFASATLKFRGDLPNPPLKTVRGSKRYAGIPEDATTDGGGDVNELNAGYRAGWTTWVQNFQTPELVAGGVYYRLGIINRDRGASPNAPFFAFAPRAVCQM